MVRHDRVAAERMAEEILLEHGRLIDETRGLVPMSPSEGIRVRDIPALPAATYAAMLRGL